MEAGAIHPKNLRSPSRKGKVRAERRQPGAPVAVSPASARRSPARGHAPANLQRPPASAPAWGTSAGSRRGRRAAPERRACRPLLTGEYQRPLLTGEDRRPLLTGEDRRPLLTGEYRRADLHRSLNNPAAVHVRRVGVGPDVSAGPGRGANAGIGLGRSTTDQGRRTPTTTAWGRSTTPSWRRSWRRRPATRMPGLPEQAPGGPVPGDADAVRGGGCGVQRAGGGALRRVHAARSPPRPHYGCRP